jgi:hypothetical protein
MESCKQEQMIELEKQRMAFTKELEVQRLNMFMDAQLELEKMKRPKYSHSSGTNSTAFWVECMNQQQFCVCLIKCECVSIGILCVSN